MKDDIAIVLKQVFFVPKFKTKIISVKRLTCQGYNVTFSKHKCKITTPRHRGIILIYNDTAGLNYLKGQAMTKKEAQQWISAVSIGTQDHSTVDINEAHEKLGHIAEK